MLNKYENNQNYFFLHRNESWHFYRLVIFAGRPHEYCAGIGSRNHDSADCMSGQFLFYHENKAINNDKSRDDHDDEQPVWNALAGNAIVMMKASTDIVSEW